MANPDNALGTNGAFGGRTSVNAFNDVLGVFSGRGILNGWDCTPAGGMVVSLGGNGTDRDVAIAEDAVGNKTTVNNISEAPISVTMSSAPASNSRIDAIVAYIESSPSSDAITDNYDAVNLLVVNGTSASTPAIPTDAEIRNAITMDGASGSTCYYVVLATVTIPSGTTDIDATMISGGSMAMVKTNNINFATQSAFNTDTTEQNVTTSFSDALTVDISGFPDGSKFLVIFTATANGSEAITGYALRMRYGSSYSIIFVQGNSWGKNVAGQCVFTKVAGQNSIALQHRKDNDNSVISVARACSCMVVG